MTDFDSPWKEALERYLPQFLEFFFPEAHKDVLTRLPTTKQKDIDSLLPHNWTASPVGQPFRRNTARLAAAERLQGDDKLLLSSLPFPQYRERHTHPLTKPTRSTVDSKPTKKSPINTYLKVAQLRNGW